MVHTSQEDRRTSGSLSSLSRPHWARHWHLVRWLSTNITISKTRCHKQLFNLKTTAVSNTQTCSDSNIYFYRTWKPLRWKWTSIVGLHKQSIRVFFFFFCRFHIVNKNTQQLYSIFASHIWQERWVCHANGLQQYWQKLIGRMNSNQNIKKVRISKCDCRFPLTKAECFKFLLHISSL